MNCFGVCVKKIEHTVKEQIDTYLRRPYHKNS